MSDDNVRFKDWQCHDDGPAICREEAIKRTLAFAGIHSTAAESEIDENFTVAAVSGAPDTVGTLLIWYDVGTLLGLNDGDVVGALLDLSGNGWDALQTTDNKRPLYKSNVLNSLPSARFDGVNDDMLIAAGLDTADQLPFTLMATVWEPTNLKGLFDSAPNAANTFRFYNNNEVELHNNDPTLAFSGAGVGGCVITITAEYDGGNRKCTAHRSTTQIDQDTGGGDPIVFASARSGSINTGSDGWDAGDILELAMWNSALSTADRETVIAYMETKYGL
jgi:hypothetical protein